MFLEVKLSEIYFQYNTLVKNIRLAYVFLFLFWLNIDSLTHLYTCQQFNPDTVKNDSRFLHSTVDESENYYSKI